MITGDHAIKKLKEEAVSRLDSAQNAQDLEAFRVAYLGRKGKVPQFLRTVAGLPSAERRVAGSEGNALRKFLEERVCEVLKKIGRNFRAPHSFGETIDVSRPGKRASRGHIHVLSRVFSDIRSIFLRMGFSVVDGPEVESEWYNFDALNISKDHPARDMQDTFWLKALAARRAQVGQNTNVQKRQTSKDRLLLRTHISGIQARYMEAHEPPFRIYYEGRAFRRDATDATHNTQFHQMEILYVDKTLSVANFKFIIEKFLREFFNKDVRIRLRPAYFPFVEPGFEIDMTCVRCGGKKCTLCATGWVEICGAGMVHQNVFRAAGHIPGEWKGIAFAFGVERLAMLKYRIPDIRLFTDGDMRFIEQF